MSQTPLPQVAAAQLAAVLDGTLRVGPLMAIPQVLRELGQDPAAILREADVDPRLLDDPENTIGFGRLGQLLDRCAARTGCASFGLMLGSKGGLGSLGLVGQLGANSPDLGKALRNIMLYLHIHDRGALPTLVVAEGLASLGYTIYQPAVEGTAQIYDGAIVIINNIMRSLVGPSWQPLEVLLAHAPPADIEPYRRIFRAPVRFNAEQTSVVFPATWLRRAVPGADAKIYRTAMEHIASIASLGGGDIVDQVRRVAWNLLLSGRGDLDSVAEVFAMHSRTLNRRLRERGVSFRHVVDKVRQEVASQLLRDSDLPVMAIATAVGYKDPAAFNRAFRRWRGTTPSAWREASRGVLGAGGVVAKR